MITWLTTLRVIPSYTRSRYYTSMKCPRTTSPRRVSRKIAETNIFWESMSTLWSLEGKFENFTKLWDRCATCKSNLIGFLLHALKYLGYWNKTRGQTDWISKFKYLHVNLMHPSAHVAWHWMELATASSLDETLCLTCFSDISGSREDMQQCLGPWPATSKEVEPGISFYRGPGVRCVDVAASNSGSLEE